MNTALAEIYKDRIKDLPFVDQNRLAGLVRRYEKVDFDSAGKKVLNYFPVGCTLTAEDCRDVNKYTYLLPDAKKKSIFFFEDRGISFIERKRDAYHWRSMLVLIGWLNGKYIQVPGCYLSAPVVVNVIHALTSNHNFNSNLFQVIRPKVRQQMQKDANVFSRYTIKEAINQYLLSPYDYFSLIIETEFETNSNCVPEITMLTPTC